MRRHVRFWLIYAIAWLPYAASYVTLFVTHLGRTFFGSIKGSILSVLPAALLGVGVVAASQGITWSPNRRYRFLARLVIRGAEAVVANSADSAQHVAALGGRATVIPPGVDRALFEPTPRPSRRRILYLGGTDANKGYQTARRHATTLAGPGLRTLSPE